MPTKIPNRITDQRMAIMKIVAAKKGKGEITTQEISEKLGELTTGLENTKKVVSQMSDKNQITKIKFGLYKANETTLHFLKHQDVIAIVDYTTLLGRNAGPRKDPEPQAMAQPAPVQINISNTANTLADNITSLIEENAQYRALLLNVYKTIGDALQIEKDKDDGSSNED